MKLTITKEEINELPLISFPGKIHLISTKEQSVDAVKHISTASVLGFDTECRPSFRKGEHYNPSLLQLSTESDAYLFRLNKISLPEEVIHLLSDASIKKVGVAIANDIKELQEISMFTPQGFVEIADLAKNLKISKLGLRSLTAILLGKRLSKKAQVSNWAAAKLTVQQIDYAATDAWISLQVYQSLTELSINGTTSS